MSSSLVLILISTRHVDKCSWSQYVIQQWLLFPTRVLFPLLVDFFYVFSYSLIYFSPLPPPNIKLFLLKQSLPYDIEPVSIMHSCCFFLSSFILFVHQFYFEVLQVFFSHHLQDQIFQNVIFLQLNVLVFFLNNEL